MHGFIKQLNIQILLFLLLIGIIFAVFQDWSSKETKATRSRMDKWAEKLDRNVKASGVYIKWESDTLPENDVWGTPLKVDYKNEGVAELLFVKSAGEDKLWETEDDLAVSKMQINAKGIGEGIKEHTSEVAKEATKGVVEGIKEETSKATASAKEKIKSVGMATKEKAIGLIDSAKNKFSESKQNKPYRDRNGHH